MSMTMYSLIGSSLGKLLNTKPKPIILAKSVSQESIPFLQGFETGTTLKKRVLSSGTTKTFVIQPGQNAQEIAKAAQDAGIIGSSDDFYRTLVGAKADQSLVPGSYLVAPGISYPDLIEQLSAGAVHIQRK